MCAQVCYTQCNHDVTKLIGVKEIWLPGRLSTHNPIRIHSGIDTGVNLFKLSKRTLQRINKQQKSTNY